MVDAALFDLPSVDAPIRAQTVDGALIRRIEAAVSSAGVQRSAVDFDWPECHRKNCQHRHGDVDSAMGTMKHAVMEAVRGELLYETTTRPDVADDSDPTEEQAAMVLATILHRYNVHDAGTFIRAARLIVDAYPEIVSVLGPAVPEPSDS